MSTLSQDGASVADTTQVSMSMWVFIPASSVSASSDDGWSKLPLFGMGASKDPTDYTVPLPQRGMGMQNWVNATSAFGNANVGSGPQGVGANPEVWINHIPTGGAGWQPLGNTGHGTFTGVPTGTGSGTHSLDGGTHLFVSSLGLDAGEFGIKDADENYVSGLGPFFDGSDCSGVMFTESISGKVAGPPFVFSVSDIFSPNIGEQRKVAQLILPFPLETDPEQSSIIWPSALYYNNFNGSLSFVGVGRMTDPHDQNGPSQFVITSVANNLLVLDSWNHIFFSFDSSGNPGLAFLVVNNSIQATQSYHPHDAKTNTDGLPVAVSGYQIGLPLVPDDISRNYTTGPNYMIRYAYVQIWLDRYLDETTDMSKFFTIKGSTIVPPTNPYLAQNTYGTSDIFFYRDKNNKVDFVNNNGSAGGFSGSGSIIDYYPGPGQS